MLVAGTRPLAILAEPLRRRAVVAAAAAAAVAADAAEPAVAPRWCERVRVICGLSTAAAAVAAAAAVVAWSWVMRCLCSTRMCMSRCWMCCARDAVVVPCTQHDAGGLQDAGAGDEWRAGTKDRYEDQRAPWDLS